MFEWFEKLTGFRELEIDTVPHFMELRGNKLFSKANGREWQHGSLEITSLAELRARLAAAAPSLGQLHVMEVVADVGDLHEYPANAGACFQVSAQFNLLEMMYSIIPPELGITRYEFDGTQGHISAVACAAGTLYRNYFVPLGDQLGQTRERQINCLEAIGRYLGHEEQPLWEYENGYIILSEEGLGRINSRLAILSPEEWERLKGLLDIGIHWDTEVTRSKKGHCVTQVFGTPLIIEDWQAHPTAHLERFTRLVLEASYEASLITGLLNAQRTGKPVVYLTLLGEGAYEKEGHWIIDALEGNLRRFQDYALEVRVVSHGAPNPIVEGLLGDW